MSSTYQLGAIRAGERQACTFLQKDVRTDLCNVILQAACYATTAGHMHGAQGWVTELGPLWPEFEMRYWDLLAQGDYKAAQLHRHRMAPLFQFVFDNPSTSTAYSWITIIKAALEYIGLEGGPVRPPFRELNASEKQRVFDLLESLGVPKGA